MPDIFVCNVCGDKRTPIPGHVFDLSCDCGGTMRPKLKHGPNISVSTKHLRQPRTFSHAVMAVQQAKSDILALRGAGSNGNRSRSVRNILASLSMQIHAVERFLEGE